LDVEKVAGGTSVVLTTDNFVGPATDPVFHTAVDGSEFELAGVDFVFSPTSFAVWRVGSKRHMFGAGNHGYARHYALEELGVGQFSETYSLEQGDLNVGSWVSLDSPDGRYRSDRIIGVWEGLDHSFWVTFPGETSEYLLWLLDLFSISESSSGVSLTERDPATASLIQKGERQPFALQFTPGLGILEISSMDAARAAALPAWSGLQVTGGELFRLGPLGLTDGGTYTPLLLATDTARVYVDPDLRVPEEDALGGIGKLTVSWRARAA
jgi:hypothetical protein